MEKPQVVEEKGTKFLENGEDAGPQCCVNNDNSNHEAEKAPDDVVSNDIEGANQDGGADINDSPGCDVDASENEILASTGGAEARESDSDGAAEFAASIVGEVISAACPQSPATPSSRSADKNPPGPAVSCTPNSCNHSPDVSADLVGAARKRCRSEDVAMEEPTARNGEHLSEEAAPTDSDVPSTMPVVVSQEVPSPKRAKLGSPTEMDVVSPPVIAQD